LSPRIKTAWSPYDRYLIGFILSGVFAYCWTPILRQAALQLGIVDKPDGRLKKHDNVIPYLGGVAVFAAYLLTIGVLTDFEDREMLGLLLSGCIALVVGLIDDFGVLNPKQKLLGQALAALVLIKSGTFIKLTFLPYGWRFRSRSSGFWR
jgi:UDP-GlcNAc:undecaprenyl-phosphate GlcNAc-1-phosphate transferase